MAQITNTGTITKIKGNKVVVKVDPQSSCHHCSVKDSCYTQSCTPRMIEVYTDKASSFTVDEKVTVYIEETSAWKAIFYAYILPLLLIITTLVIGLLWNTNEIAAALYSLLILIPYYLILYLSKTWIRDKIKFGIEKME